MFTSWGGAYDLARVVMYAVEKMRTSPTSKVTVGLREVTKCWSDGAEGADRSTKTTRMESS